jgi:hypothetical protein
MKKYEEEEVYIYALLTFILDGGECHLHAPTALPQYPLYREVGGLQRQSGRDGGEKNQTDGRSSKKRAHQEYKRA